MHPRGHRGGGGAARPRPGERQRLGPGTGPQNPENVRRVEALVTEEDWGLLFPAANPAYTYTGLLQVRTPAEDIQTLYV